MERLIDPVIADLQHECDRAKATGQALRTGIVWVRGYCAFWRVFTLHVPAVWLQRTIGEFRASHHESFIRMVLPAAIAMVMACAALIVEPARSIRQPGMLGVWLVILLVPQSIPFSVPLGLFTGIAYGLRRRPVTRQVRRLVVILGLTGTLASASTIIWVLPIANQAFRTAVARRVVIEGPGEMSTHQIREQALALRNQGRMSKAGDLLLTYHARWALVGAAFVFAVFGLGVTTLGLGRVATIMLAATALVLYVTYFDQLGAARASSVFSHEGAAVLFAWLPNVLILLTSLAFLTKRDGQNLVEPENEPSRTL